MKTPKTTAMRYQVEGGNTIHRSRCMTLREARGFARALVEKGLCGVQIARYDTSGQSHYYEVVEVLS